MTEEKIYDLKLRYKKELRLVRIFVPAHDEGERMPVIYMSDGQNLFEEEKCTFGCWHVREAVREAMEKGIGKAVVVGIYNDKNRQRVSDLTPSTIGKWRIFYNEWSLLFMLSGVQWRESHCKNKAFFSHRQRSGMAIFPQIAFLSFNPLKIKCDHFL